MSQDPGTNNQVTESPNYQMYIGIWHEVASGINSGAYAVLLAIALLYVVTRRAIGRVWEQHFALLEMLRRATVKNSESIRIMAVTHRRLADQYIKQGAQVDPTRLLEALMDTEGLDDHE